MGNLIGAFIFLIVGGGFFYAGYYIRKLNRRIEKNGIKTKAKIIDFTEERMKDADGNSYLYHFPIISFTNQSGIAITQKLDSSENPKKVNEFIDIIYLKKDNNYEIMINSDFWKRYFSMIFIIGGILFFGIGLIW